MRVVCHSQHLTGIGHHVRMHCLASGLARAHEVHLVDGGRPVPRPHLAAEPQRLRLPTLARTATGELVGGDGGPAAPVVLRRAQVLADAIDAIRPDVLLVDHYPFSKWELTTEIDAAIAATRAANRSARVVCSLRDIAPQTRHEHLVAERYVREVARRLDDGFDALLVHADPRWSDLARDAPAAIGVTVPVRATGYVVEPPVATPVAVSVAAWPSAPFAVASAGGLDATEFLLAVIAAHAALVDAPPDALPDVPGTIHVFAPAGAPEPELDRLRAASARHGARAEVYAFSPGFGAWLDAAALSVSRAGYNTCAALLRAPGAAVLVPDPRLSDQIPRARVLADAGFAVTVEAPGAAPPTSELTAAMAAALARPGSRSEVATEGVAVTVDLLERLVAGEDPWGPEWMPEGNG